MALTGSGQISIQDIANELGIPATGESLDSLASKTLNDCSTSQPNPANPDAMSEWYSYDHSALPSLPTSRNVSMTGSGVTAGQADNWLAVSGSSFPLCVIAVEIHSGSTSGGTFTLAARVEETEWQNGWEDTGLGAETTVWYKVRSLGTIETGSFSAAIEGKTGPTSPKSLGDSGTGDQSTYAVTLTWNNGTSPGVRSMEPLEWRKNITSSGWTSWTRDIGAGSTSKSGISCPGLTDGDTIAFEVRYITETTAATTTHTVLLTI